MLFLGIGRSAHLDLGANGAKLSQWKSGRMPLLHTKTVLS